MVSEWFGVDMIGPSMSLTDELETTTRILLSMYAHVASTNHNIIPKQNNVLSEIFISN
jgi:hypothetical protein